MPDRVVAVVGGGIAGLAAARTLARSPGIRVKLIEATGRLGGVIVTDEIEGIRVEAGPDSFLGRDPEMVDLCRSLGVELEPPAIFGGMVWSRGRLRRLPDDLVLGFPSSPLSLIRAGLLSPLGAVRAAADLFGHRLAGADVAIGPWVRMRFGRELLETIVDPLLAGTRAGDVATMSLAAAAPPIDRAARRHRSVILGLRHARRTGDAAAARPSFLAPTSGMGSLVDALRQDLGATEILLQSPVRHLENGPGSGYLLKLPDREVKADGVVLAVPSATAGRALASIEPHAAAELDEIAYASVAVIALVYPESAGSPPSGGSGLLVPAAENSVVAAATFYSRKWPGCKPERGNLIRAVVGRADRSPLLKLADDELVDEVHRDLATMMGLSGRPRAFKVWRWMDSLPQYEVGHLDRVARIRAALDRHRALTVCGAAYGGAGIPDCISGGADAAHRVMADLR